MTAAAAMFGAAVAVGIVGVVCEVSVRVEDWRARQRQARLLAAIARLDAMRAQQAHITVVPDRVPFDWTKEVGL